MAGKEGDQVGNVTVVGGIRRDSIPGVSSGQAAGISIDASGNIRVTVDNTATPSTGRAKKVTASGADTSNATQLSGSSLPLQSGLTIKNPAAAGDEVRIGFQQDLSDGGGANYFELAAGEQVFVEIDDVSSVYAAAEGGSDVDIYYIGS